MSTVHPSAGPPPRQVLYVENGIGYGGAVICLRHLMQHLDPARYRPLLVTGRTGPEYQPLADDAPWWVVRDRRVDTRRWQQELARQAWPGQLPGLRWLLNQGCARTDDLANFLPQVLQLYLLARRLRPALLHANNEPLCNRAALLVARALGIPSVCHVRGVLDTSPLTRSCYQLPDHIVSVSHWIDRGLADIGLPEARRSVVYDGIDLERMDQRASGLALRQRLGLPIDAFVVGLVGLLIPWKGQALLLDAAPGLFQAIPKLQLVFVGGTPADCGGFEQLLRQRVAASPWGNRVHFAGHLTNMPEVYNGVDVVLSASIEPEPLGTVVIESMAMGRALVAPAFGGAAEMATHEVNALLFTPGDPQSLTENLIRLASDPDLSVRLGAAARTHALSTFAVATHAERIQALYDSMLATREGRHS